MKKRLLAQVILFLFFLTVIIIIGVIFLYNYKKINNKEITEKTKEILISEPVINPSTLIWEQITPSALFEGRDSQAVVVYKNKIWLMGGVNGSTRLIYPGNVDYGNAPHFNDVWSSEDGVNWQLVLNKAPWGKRRSMQAVNFKGKIFLMGGWGPEIGLKNDVWSSEDGIKWKLETSSARWESREGHQVAVYKNKIWLMGGVKYNSHKLFNDVWSSEDGVNWKKEADNAFWSPRWDHAIVGFNNKLWVIGGMDLKGNVYKDIWSSEDGANWFLVDDNPPFLSRQGFAMLDYQNKIWVIGRLNTSEYGNGTNDIWYSKDGVIWEKTKEDPLWTGREDFGAVIFKNKMWILGGMDKNWEWKNDVWRSKSDIVLKK